MRAGNHRQGQLGFGAQCVEARGIEDGEPRLQQWMRVVDHGIAPYRHLDRTIGAQRMALAVVLAVPQTQLDGLDRRHRPRLGEFFQAFLQLARVVWIERHAAPFDGHALQTRQRRIAAPRLDRQQMQAGCLVGVVAEFGRAHGGAADIGRQQALAMIGKEECIDEFGLAARELGDEDHHQAVLAQAGSRVGKTQGALGIDAVLVVQPVGVVGDRGRQLQAALAVVGDFLFQMDAHILLFFST